jgi:hypothetical protein
MTALETIVKFYEVCCEGVIFEGKGKRKREPEVKVKIQRALHLAPCGRGLFSV